MPSDGESERLGPYTVAEFEALPEEDLYRVELVRGYLVREPRPASLHGRVLARITYLFEQFLDQHPVGVLVIDVGFVLQDVPPTVRGPDLAFVRREHLPENVYDPGFLRFPPDIAIEITSPSNRPAEIRQKVREYFAAGSQLVWVIDPARRVVTIHEALDRTRVIGSADALEGGAVVPGLRIEVAAIFRL